MFSKDLTPAPGRGRLPGRSRGNSGAFRNRHLLDRSRGLLSLRLLLRLGRSLPVVEHLRRKDEVEREAGQVPVQDERVVDLLHGSEDAGERTGEVVEHLGRQVSTRRTVEMGSSRVTYREGAQLPGASLAPDGEDLGRFARNPQDSRPGLEIGHGLCVHQRRVDQQSVHARRDDGDPCGGRSGLPAERQDQDANHDILHRDECRFAVRAEGELLANAVGKRDEKAGGFKRIRGERDAGRGARIDQLHDLGHLDDRAGGDDAEPQGLGDGERRALGVFGHIEVDEEGPVARPPDEGDDGIIDRLGQVFGDGNEVGLERVKHDCLELVHGGQGMSWLRSY